MKPGDFYKLALRITPSMASVMELPGRIIPKGMAAFSAKKVLSPMELAYREMRQRVRLLARQARSGTSPVKGPIYADPPRHRLSLLNSPTEFGLTPAAATHVTQGVEGGEKLLPSVLESVKSRRSWTPEMHAEGPGSIRGAALERWMERHPGKRTNELVYARRDLSRYKKPSHGARQQQEAPGLSTKKLDKGKLRALDPASGVEAGAIEASPQAVARSRMALSGGAESVALPGEYQRLLLEDRQRGILDKIRAFLALPVSTKTISPVLPGSTVPQLPGSSSPPISASDVLRGRWV